MPNLTVIKHPLVRHKLTLMRSSSTTTAEFRKLLREISLLLGYEVTRDLALEMHHIETPLATMQSPLLAGKKPALISVLRAGNGLLDGMLDLMPSARVGHIGLYRDPTTLAAVEYYFKIPKEIEDRPILVLDPMLATGNSAVAAVERIKQAGGRRISMVCLLVAPEGVSTFHATHPDVDVFTAAVDARLDEHGYIVPGLGDAGDRLYGTR